MRVLGVDYGRVRLGLAMSDEGFVLASPLPHYHRARSLREDLRYIANLASEHDIKRIVIGLPLHMNGSIGEMAEEAAGFADEVERSTGLVVERIDERLTTAEAERTLLEADVSRKKRKGLRDSLAAVLILQSYLDRERSEF